MASFPTSNRPPPIITNVPQMYPPPMLPSMHPISAAQSRTGYRPPQIYNNPPNIPFSEEDGPLVTVFIGNLSEKAPDTMIKKILACCGLVVNWKRVSTFGFCEYDGPVSGGRAVRLLHDLDLDGKKLVAKVDAKNKQLLDSYKEEESKKSENSNSKTRDADSEKRFDATTMERIESVLEEYKDELKTLNSNSDQPPAHKQSKQTHQSFEIEEGKRDLINKEIGKFRKYAEEEELKKEKEKDRKKRESEKERGSEKERNSDKDKDKRRSPSPSRKDKKPRRRSRSRSRERERERREKKMEREKERDLERQKEREEREIRDRERQREREREREIQEPKVFKNVKELQKEKEMEDEARDRKKNEKRIRDKEAAYQERLRNWEARERRKGKEYEKEREKEFCKEEDREKEAKCLKEFLEDYDDERDDPKYYKSRELARRTTERTRERDADEKDRIKEQEELDELKSKIFNGAFEDPTQEFERLKKEREELYKPKILIDVNLEQSQQREKELEREYQRELDRQRARDRQKKQKEQYVIEQANREMAAIDAEPIDSDSSGGQQDFPSSPPPNHIAMSQHGSESRDSFTNNNDVMMNNDEELSSNSLLSNTPTQNSPSAALNTSGSTGLATGFSLNLNANIKKKKIDVKDVFNMDEDGEEISVSKKRKLVPLDYEDPKSKRRADEERHKKTSDDAQRSQEEKRKHVKSIIDKIPTAKAELFNFPLDWAEIDATIEKKVRPWINKKIIEYIGEPEPTLVDFICSKVLAGSTPQSILDDVQMVLDEEAEVFVVKMWRLLIYEVEAKKRGLK